MVAIWEEMDALVKASVFPVNVIPLVPFTVKFLRARPDTSLLTVIADGGLFVKKAATLTPCAEAPSNQLAVSDQLPLTEDVHDPLEVARGKSVLLPHVAPVMVPSASPARSETVDPAPSLKGQ